MLDAQRHRIDVVSAGPAFQWWPEDSLALFDELGPPPDLLCVTTRSPKAARRATYLLARYFQREEGYDFVQYGCEGQEDDKSARAFLWTAEGDGRGRRGMTAYAYGATCFRWREWRDAPSGWAMQWVWFHPHWRRKGRLRAAWPFFRRAFGEFHVEPPLSKAMKAFVRAMDAPPATP